MGGGSGQDIGHLQNSTGGRWLVCTLPSIYIYIHIYICVNNRKLLEKKFLEIWFDFLFFIFSLFFINNTNLILTVVARHSITRWLERFTLPNLVGPMYRSFSYLWVVINTVFFVIKHIAIKKFIIWKGKVILFTLLKNNYLICFEYAFA